jgi:hypothetical protein
MSQLQFLCRTCNALRETACGDTHVYPTARGWVIECPCPVCGTDTATPTSNAMAAAVIYWQKVDDQVAYAQLRCRAYAGDLSEDELAELGVLTVFEVEEYLREVAR